ncbi:MAG: ASPIC/UnbV domain-containing protein, partial [Bacteroidota bacterium]
TNAGRFVDVGDGGMGWGTVWMDYDNDGWPDLYVTNDYKFTPSPNLLYRNQRDGTFLDVAPGTDLESRLAGYGCATADVNLDGSLDLVVANLTQQNQLFLNETSNGHHWLALHLEGTQSNRSAVGARITVYAGSESYLREVRAGSGFAAQQSHWQHFGLMLNAAVDSVVVRWPNGTVEQFTGLEVDRFYRVTEGGTAALAFAPTSAGEAVAALPLKAVVSPNPFSDQVQFQVQVPAGTAWQLTVSDVTGREVFSESMRASNGQPWAWAGTDQHGNPVPNGVYFYRLSSTDQVLSGKLVRQR